MRIAAILLPLCVITVSAAQGPESAQIRVLQVRDNVYMLVGPDGNTTLQVEPETRPTRIPGAYLGTYGVLVVDPQSAASGEALRTAIRRISQGPIRFVINTHIHPDRIGGNEAVAKPAGGRGGDPTLIVSHENVLLKLAEEGRVPQGGLPTDTYLDVKEIWLNGEAIQLFHQPNAHTDGDTIVYFRKSDVISAGDLYMTTSYPVIDTAHGGTIQGVIDGLNRILDIAIPENSGEGGTMIIPGQGRLSDESDVVEYRNMVVIVRDRVQDAIRKGMTLEQVQAAAPSRDYDSAYVTPTSFVKAADFVAAIYRSLTAK